MWMNNTLVLVLIAMIPLASTGCRKKGKEAATATEETTAATACSGAEISASPFASGDGSAATPYKICSAAQLNEVRNYLSAEFVLADDLDLNGVSFAPITGFAGVFDGDSKAIANFGVTTSSGATGLFATVLAAGVVKNVALTNALVSVNGTSGNVGALAGENSGTIENCSTSGTVSGTFSSSNQADQSAGGLVGENFPGAVVRASHSSVIVNAIGAFANAGGLIGMNYQSTIEKSYALGAVATGATSYNSGGLVGWNNSGTITDSFARGSVTAAFGGNYAGGLVGWNFPTGSSIQRTYATGAVTGIGGMGGLIYNSLATTEVVDSYFDTQTTGRANTSGGSARTTAQMHDQTTFVGWDFTTVWNIAPASYPELK